MNDIGKERFSKTQSARFKIDPSSSFESIRSVPIGILIAQASEMSSSQQLIDSLINTVKPQAQHLAAGSQEVAIDHAQAAAASDSNR
jgi:KaiC/GvpD/RAD55 family RecA-like ATPase